MFCKNCLTTISESTITMFMSRGRNNYGATYYMSLYYDLLSKYGMWHEYENVSTMTSLLFQLDVYAAIWASLWWLWVAIFHHEQCLWATKSMSVLPILFDHQVYSVCIISPWYVIFQYDCNQSYSKLMFVSHQKKKKIYYFDTLND